MKRRLEVFGASPEAIQIVWRGRGNGHGTLELSGQRAELSTDHDIGAHTFTGLAPATTYDIALDGRRVATARTLPRPAGRRLGTVATISDLHVGEIGTGHLPRVSSQHARSAWPSAHPVWCLEAAVEALNDWHPDLVVAKGDLSHGNLPEEYDVVAKLLLGLDAPVLVIPGNHDGGNIQRSDFGDEMVRVGFDADAVQTRSVGEALVIVADTRIDGHHAGAIRELVPRICAVAAESDGPVLVALHHQLMTTTFPYYIPTGIPKDEADEFLAALALTAPGALVTSGHTHRHRARRSGTLTITEVGSTKDYPGTWAWYELYEGGITQTVWRIEASEVLAWTELTRTTAKGVWGRWAPGRFDDRCLVSVSP